MFLSQRIRRQDKGNANVSSQSTRKFEEDKKDFFSWQLLMQDTKEKTITYLSNSECVWNKEG